MTGAIRNRLHRLWATLTDPRMEKHLESDDVVPSRFLADNNITLDLTTFLPSDTAADNLNKKPPFLFLIRPESIVTAHPIILDDEYFYPGVSGVRDDDPSPATQVRMLLQEESKAFHRGTSLAHYIVEWAIRGYLRVLPAGIPNLATFCGIRSVCSPHPLNTETRGLERSSGRDTIEWEARIYEYGQRSNGRPVYPHLILLGVQSCDGHTNSISLGELTTIVTAMRCRAFQPAAFNSEAILVGDVEQSDDGNPMPDHEDKLAFPHETRFPVLMVSVVGPQHVRVIYACMDGLTLSIKTSVCRDIGTDEETVMRYIAGIILSSPLVEIASATR